MGEKSDSFLPNLTLIFLCDAFFRRSHDESQFECVDVVVVVVVVVVDVVVIVGVVDSDAFVIIADVVVVNFVDVDAN